MATKPGAARPAGAKRREERSPTAAPPAAATPSRAPSSQDEANPPGEVAQRTAASAAPGAGGEGPVLAVLEDSAAGAWLIECSAALARAFGRELGVVHVQSTLALQAAALPQTQALAHFGAPWAPLEPQDVERGWRAQAARLQALAAPIASRHALRWSLRTVRGEPGAVARGLLEETDLLFLGAVTWPVRAPVAAAARGPRGPAPASLAVLDDGSEAARRAAEVAARLAAARPTHWRLRALTVGDAAALDALLQRPPALDALVLPRQLVSPARWSRLARLGCPVLLIA